MRAVSCKGVSNCFAISLRFRFAIQLWTKLETCLQWLLPSLQLEETEQLITMPVKLTMLQSKCSRVSKLLGTASETCLQRCLPQLKLHGDQALARSYDWSCIFHYNLVPNICIVHSQTAYAFLFSTSAIHVK